MAPDINTLSSIPRSPLAHSRPRRISTAGVDMNSTGPPSPRSPSLSSLQAAATINASLHHSPNSASPARTGLERRRSSLMTNFAINDPVLPSAGELQSSSNSSPRLGRRSIALSGAMDPHHHRRPSLGELHQKLEEEQEAQANRLLHMIRLQQDQLNTLQAQQNPLDPSPTSETVPGHAPAHPSEHPASRSGSIAGLPHGHGVFNRPTSLSRQSSSRISNTGTSSHADSPGMPPSTGSLGPLTEDFLLGGTRDESAFYQAETQMLTRENQMLKQRIRELERQVSELNGSSGHHASNGAAVSHSPATNSPLARAAATFDSQADTDPEA